MAVLLEKELSRPDRPVQCYPFGVSGYGTTQQYQIIRHYILDFKPDVVIVFFTANDVYDCSPYLSAVDSSFARYRLDAAGALEPMPMTSWTPSGLRRWAAKSAIARYMLIQKRLLNPRRAGGPAGVTLRETRGQSASAEFLGAKMSMEERGKMSWLLVERLLAVAKADCAARGAKLAVVYRGNLPEIEAAEDGKTYIPPPRDDDPYCLDSRIFEMGKDFLAPMAIRLGIDYLDLTPALVERVRATGRPHNFADDDHYNELGHSVAADQMARLVDGLLEGSPPQ
jgi:hypothetical protein